MNEFDKLLKEYPEYVTKELLRLIAHVSKQTARYYLQSGLIPCVYNGKKTRNYKIKMTDIIFFLKDRAENLEVYSLKNSYNIRQSNSRKFTAIPKKELPSFHCYLRSTLEDCQDG